MEAVEHVEKIRVNPQLRRQEKFAVREYSDADYAELQRLHAAFSRSCNAVANSAARSGSARTTVAQRRIMNCYGDSRFRYRERARCLRIAESHSCRQIILSMKSELKVMIRPTGSRRAHDPEDMHHCCTSASPRPATARTPIKGAIGIGSLLLDGLGDTIRVSLTEDSVMRFRSPVRSPIGHGALGARRTPVAPIPSTRIIHSSWHESPLHRAMPSVPTSPRG